MPNGLPTVGLSSIRKIRKPQVFSGKACEPYSILQIGCRSFYVTLAALQDLALQKIFLAVRPFIGIG